MQGVNSRPAVASGQLADAFASFIAAAERLESSHRQLHQEVASLRMQLEERNRALASSVAENERMRVTLREILDALPCGVAVLEPEAEKVVLLNPEARHLLGISASQPAWTDFSREMRLVLERAKAHSWKHGDEHDFNFEGDEGKRWVTVRYSIMNDNAAADSSDQKPVILTCRDTTTAKETEEQRDSCRNLVALAEMATVLAHEIRNPLGSLELLARLLALDAGLSTDSKKCVEHLQSGVRLLSAVVNNVLRFHSTGATILHPSKLADTLRSAVEFAQPLARQAEVSLVLKESLAETEIAADASELQQVILNLVCNSLRHTNRGGQIVVSASVRTAAKSKTAVIEVADTGTGISAEDLPHIFEPGFSTRQGAGLGLTVCQRIIEQHSGTITAQSRTGEGTVFRMEFPVL
jgi:two-component system sensor histidine kinase FlrB